MRTPALVDQERKIGKREGMWASQDGGVETEKDLSNQRCRGMTGMGNELPSKRDPVNLTPIFSHIPLNFITLRFMNAMRLLKCFLKCGLILTIPLIFLLCQPLFFAHWRLAISN